MAEQAWDQKLTDFLKAAGEELRRTGEELKAETQRLLDEVTDSEMQAKLKEGIQQRWQVAKRTAAEATTKLQEAFGESPRSPPGRSPQRPRSPTKPRGSVRAPGVVSGGASPLCVIISSDRGYRKGQVLHRHR